MAINLVSCRPASIPRPYGYFRITTPEHTYTPITYGNLRFDLSDNAILSADRSFSPLDGQTANRSNSESVTQTSSGLLFNIHYSTLNADIHCTYKPVDGNLRELTDDALNFVYKHVQQATAIPEKEYSNPEAKVYGVYFELAGNTASPYQFFLTDSTKHFFRGAAYCFCKPNADSLAPILDYLHEDILHLIESLQWKY